MADEKATQQALRELIDAVEIIAQLEDHIRGRVKLSATQVSAALALLKKILPDPKAAGDETGEHEESIEDLA